MEKNIDLTYLTLLLLRIQKHRQVKSSCLKHVEEELKKKRLVSSTNFDLIGMYSENGICHGGYAFGYVKKTHSS